MRTNIVIDDDLLEGAMRATGAKTKREAVELGLAALVRLKKQEESRGLRGKLRWTGDLDEMRRDGRF
ncbi:MAG: type II toxin-antitoxin system VapB family antitoxin [Thiotrichales bacterium]|nr:type II toxin-antitoxin system VapB family antitoxin [Thiotrichales bacterium]